MLRIALFFGVLGLLISCQSSQASEHSSAQVIDSSSQVSSTDLAIDTTPIPVQDSVAWLLRQRMSYFGTSGEQKPCDVLPSHELGMLQEGDILLRKGYGAVSDFIALYLDEEYTITHCGFVLLNGYDEPHILHTASSDEVDGMYAEPISDFVTASQEKTLAAVRLKKGTATQQKKVLQEAKRLLAKKVPFDMAFDDYDTTKMYCAEMMRYVFMEVYKEDLLDDRAQEYGLDVIHMSNFFNPERFEIIFNHNAK
ncbi:MAG: hypothetical protein GY810_09125 [Aureispira sp.]|nr:hypothetical protein [Aureispira sp.]